VEAYIYILTNSPCCMPHLSAACWLLVKV